MSRTKDVCSINTIMWEWLAPVIAVVLIALAIGIWLYLRRSKTRSHELPTIHASPYRNIMYDYKHPYHVEKKIIEYADGRKEEVVGQTPDGRICTKKNLTGARTHPRSESLHNCDLKTVPHNATIYSDRDYVVRAASLLGEKDGV